MKNKTAKKSMSAGGIAGALSTWAAYELNRKYAVPIEVLSPAVGGIFAFIAAWAGRLMPDPPSE